MDFKPSPQVETLRERILDFMDGRDLPAGAGIMEALDAEVAPGVPYPQSWSRCGRGRSRMGSGTSSCRRALRPGLSNWEYGLLCEEMGRSPAAAPMAFNCSAPDTGNMAILADTAARSSASAGWSRCSRPLRSCFSMTEPGVSARTRPCCRRAPCATATSGDRRPQWFTSVRWAPSWRSRWSSPTPGHRPTTASMICVPTDHPGLRAGCGRYR